MLQFFRVGLSQGCLELGPRTPLTAWREAAYKIARNFSWGLGGEAAALTARKGGPFIDSIYSVFISETGALLCIL